MRKKHILRIVLPVIAIMVLLLTTTMPVSAATSTGIVVTNTPQFISISVSPDTYEFNGADTLGVKPNTTYYSNPDGGQETAPTGAGALDAECAFTITNGSNIATDLTVTSSDMSGGSDNSTNGNTGSAGATSYGAKTYFSGQATAAWVVAKSAGSSVGYENLSATTNIKFGLILAEQTDAWTGADAATFTVTITAAAH